VTVVARAVLEVVNLGGSLVREAVLYPEADPLLEQAIVADPSGNEFVSSGSFARPCSYSGDGCMD